jgi:hypothetical protein
VKTTFKLRLIFFLFVGIANVQLGMSQESCEAPAERSVACFGAKPDGTSDNASAFKAAADWANQGSQTSPRSLYFPAGTYSYSGGLIFTQPVTLHGTIDAILNYTGAHEAIRFGPDGLTNKTFHYTPYVVDGLSFTGGAKMTQGIYFNTFTTQTKVVGTRFINFGNASAYNIFFQSQNWYNLVDGVSMWSQSGPYMNGIRTNGYNTDGTTSDNGQSRTIITNSLLQFSGGTGIYISGFHSQLNLVTVSGNLKAPIQVGSWGNFVNLDHVYEEAGSKSQGCIVYGDESGARASQPVTNLTLQNSYCNLHNADFSSKAAFIVPATQNSALKLLRVENDVVSSVSSDESRPLIVQNNRAGQSGNRADGLLIAKSVSDQVPVPASRLHSKGTSIESWGGQDGDSAKK